MGHMKAQRVVRYHPPVGLSQLFRPLPKSEARPRLEVEYQVGNGRILRFSAREALGVPEQTLLLVILELAGMQYVDMGQAALLREADTEQISSRLWSSLYPHGGAGSRSTVMVQTTWEELNRRCGSGNGGSAIQTRKECLRRLCEVVVWEEVSRRRVSYQSFLMVWLMGDDRRIHLALNHRLAAVFLGEQYAKVALHERLLLGRDLPKFLHAFFCTCIRPGHQLKLGLTTLAARAWPVGHDTAPKGTVRRRQSELVLAVKAIARLPGWKIDWEDGMRLITVYRVSAERAREMPFASERQIASYSEQGVAENFNKNKHLRQNDVSGLFNKKGVPA